MNTLDVSKLTQDQINYLQKLVTYFKAKNALIDDDLFEELSVSPLTLSKNNELISQEKVDRAFNGGSGRENDDDLITKAEIARLLNDMKA